MKATTFLWFLSTTLPLTSSYADEGSGMIRGTVRSRKLPQNIPVNINECDDDLKCKILINKQVMSVCEWVKVKPQKRCGMESKGLVISNSMPKSYDATYVGSICQKTCKFCEGELLISKTPTTSSLAPECDDDHNCKLIFQKKVISICEWAAKKPFHRCRMESKGLVNPTTTPVADDAIYVADICKKTCKICGTPDKTIMPSLVPTTFPSKQLSTGCKDDQDCLILVKGEVMTICEWAALKPSKRCNIQSKALMNKETAPPSYDTTYVKNKCKKTCRLCRPLTSKPSLVPSTLPSYTPTPNPTYKPSSTPSQNPVVISSVSPSLEPTMVPLSIPSFSPTSNTSSKPSSRPSYVPTLNPTIIPSFLPSQNPSTAPSVSPSFDPTMAPSLTSSTLPSNLPTLNPLSEPSSRPSHLPTMYPIVVPSYRPSLGPEASPSTPPSSEPSAASSLTPSSLPSDLPTSRPSSEPSSSKSYTPTTESSSGPSHLPTIYPAVEPSYTPSLGPAALSIPVSPSSKPTVASSLTPSTSAPMGSCDDTLVILPVSSDNTAVTLCDVVKLKKNLLCPLNMHEIRSFFTSIANNDSGVSILFKNKNEEKEFLSNYMKYNINIPIDISVILAGGNDIGSICKNTCGSCATDPQVSSLIPTMKSSSIPSTISSTIPSFLPSDLPSHYPSSKLSSEPSSEPSFAPTSAPIPISSPGPSMSPTFVPTECEDDTECSVVAKDHHLMQLCVWVALDISRCGYLSKTVIYPIPTLYDATYVYNICKKTCAACDGIYKAPSASPTPPQTECKDDKSCFTITQKDKRMKLCTWVARKPSIRCKLRSKKYVTPLSMPTTYDATLVNHICKRTCGICSFDGTPDVSVPNSDVFVHYSYTENSDSKDFKEDYLN